MSKSVPLRLGLPAALGAAVLTALLGGPAWADDAAPAAAPVEAQAAVWVPKEVQFTYMGFTTHYSCDGLRDSVRDILLQLGARKSDLKVYEQPCSGDPNRPNPFPGVRIKMSVLQPAPAAASADTKTVPAHWKTVKLPATPNSLNAAGQCELIEQINQKIVPLFTTRNVDFRTTCVPHQLTPGGTTLTAEVLVTDQKKPAKAASAADAR
ncbi:MAG TPA: hypothetical protein VHB68_04475 [Steroidobacteraceae bacterium]|nr:hypothetical protein [Steroidobacteraceae bacterium]